MTISLKTHKLLWGRAASRCAFPNCQQELVINGTETDDESVIGEECHIVGQEINGPRGISSLTPQKRDEYDNLILLCRIHHKLIDDQPLTYSVERLHEMKVAHERWVSESLRSDSPVWNVPGQRNPLFTGRADLLNCLHDKLTTAKVAALTQPHAICGLGGVGKTQIAIEYAYSYRDAYRAVLWVRASALETLITDFIAIADLLHLPQRSEQDRNIIVALVKQWLTTQSDWLLIMDNADDLDMVYNFLPPGAKGHILLTSRAQATGTNINGILVEELDQHESVLLLLRRAKMIMLEESPEQAAKTVQSNAETIAKDLGGLPLALDQAGAYIEETGCSLSQYIDLYKTCRKELLKRRGAFAADHPEPVATTWSLSFHKVEETNSIAADILRLCAFLDSDAIPEEIIVMGAFNSDSLADRTAFNAFIFNFNEAMEVLRRFSLIQRSSTTEMLNIHRLVQAVLKDDMNEDMQRQWAERTVRAVHHVFMGLDMILQKQLLRQLPQVQACAVLIDQYGLISLDAADLLTRTGYYIFEGGLYALGEPLLRQAIAIYEKLFGAEHPRTAGALTNLAGIYHAQGEDEKAEPLLQQALAIEESVLGPEHPETANILNNLAECYRVQGRYEEAERLLQRALVIHENISENQTSNFSRILDNLAKIYHVQGKFTQAEQIFKRALEFSERVLGGKDPTTAANLNNLSMLYCDQGKYQEAESLLRRALAIREEILGPKHPETIISLQNLLDLCYVRGQHEQVETLLQKALIIYEDALGPEHPETASVLIDLALLYDAQGRKEQAAPLFLRALAIRKKAFGADYPSEVIPVKLYTALLPREVR